MAHWHDPANCPKTQENRVMRLKLKPAALVFLAIAILIPGTVETINAEELVKNGGFESGSLHGWTLAGIGRVTDKYRHDGAYAVALGAWPHYAYRFKLSQSLTLPQASPGTLRFWYTGVNTAGGSLEFPEMLLRFVVESGSPIVNWETKSFQTIWKQVELTIPRQDVATAATLAFEGNGGTPKGGRLGTPPQTGAGMILVDDISLDAQITDVTGTAERSFTGTTEGETPKTGGVPLSVPFQPSSLAIFAGVTVSLLSAIYIVRRASRKRHSKTPVSEKYLSYLAKLEDLRSRGQISESAYENLRKQFLEKLEQA